MFARRGSTLDLHLDSYLQVYVAARHYPRNKAAFSVSELNIPKAHLTGTLAVLFRHQHLQ